MTQSPGLPPPASPPDMSQLKPEWAMEGFNRTQILSCLKQIQRRPSPCRAALHLQSIQGALWCVPGHFSGCLLPAAPPSHLTGNTLAL